MNETVKYIVEDLSKELPVVNRSFPFIVHHPLTMASQFYYDDEFISTMDNWDKFTSTLLDRLGERNTDTYTFITVMVSKPFRLTVIGDYFDRIKEDLTKEEISQLLEFCWVTTEYPSECIKESPELIDILMEYGKNSLGMGEGSVVYRSGTPDGLSWTMLSSVAEDFKDKYVAGRYNNKVWKHTITKDDIILLSTNIRSEYEVVLLIDDVDEVVEYDA